MQDPFGGVGARTLEESLLELLADRLESSAGLREREWDPLPHQRPPEGDDWDIWIILGGRGSGKTRAGAEYVLQHLRELGPRARVGIGAPTLGDARSVCAEGDSGIITIARDEFTHYNKSLLTARHYLGGFIQFMGSEEPARWNGPQWTLLWADELALWNEDSWDQAMFGLRLGERPHAICTTTPKNRKFVKELVQKPGVVVTSATTDDNPHLHKRARERLYRDYGGTRLGRQELLAQFVSDVEGALWNSSMIEPHRRMTYPELVRVVVSVDPATTARGGAMQGSESALHKKEGESDFTGMCVAGKGEDGHFYVLHIYAYRLSPMKWAEKAIELYHQFAADRIIAEANQGGDLVEAVIKNVNPNIPFGRVHAKRGKIIRAEPVVTLYEQGKVHHVGVFTEGEDQMCAFGAPVGGAEFDDMVDALTQALTELSGGFPGFFFGRAA